MSSLTDRPFAGTWQEFGAPRGVIRMVPDCLVYVNGLTTLPGCPSCNGQIDLQKYITQVSVEPNTEPIASATLSLSIPAFAGEFFFRDGDFLLRPGLEVVIYMRGRFASLEALTSEDALPLSGSVTSTEEGVGGGGDGQTFDPTGIPVNPYYQVFHGVVTEASHEYSGGEYTASVSCSDVLHFWQNLKVSTNGAVFGPRPDSSGVSPVLQGHSFQGASPYSIIYTLYRVGFGAAGAVEYNLAKETNVDVTSEVSGQTHYKSAALWWEKRWASNSVRLKMYGADGTLYNAWTQAYLGLFSGKNPEQLKTLLGKGKTDRNPFSSTADKTLAKLARDLGYNPLSSQVSVAVDSGGNVTRQDALKQQAFSMDLSVLGNVNLFETEYLSKLEVANAVRTITGFEFYQDVTGDLVFKPPMYNMDTSTDPVYVIDDADLISASQSEREPEATYVKASGTHAAVSNVKGVGLDGWLGMTSTYIDYRLVAQFGWREAEFESSYISDTRALFVLAMNRLDLVNVGCKSASITIPLRPELRPGYPVYVKYLDCFYYIQSMSHSFQFGGQCTTTINGVAKRAKFNAPGVVPGNRPPNIGDIRLDNPYLPSLPLTLKRSEVEGQNETGPTSDPPRIQGFPNVVMALDPTKVNAGSMIYIENLPLDQIVLYALSSGVMQVSPDAEGATESERKLNGPWVIGSAENEGVTVNRTELQTQWSSLQQALAAGNTLATIVEETPTTLAQVLLNVKQQQGLLGDDQSLLNYLVLVNDAKAAFGISNNVVGTYRYYSCSHPSPEHQGTTNLALVADTPKAVGLATTPADGASPADEFFAAWSARVRAEAAELAGAAVPPNGTSPAPLDSPTEVQGFVFQPPSPSSTARTSTTGTSTGGDASSLAPLSAEEVDAYYGQVLTGIGVADTANNRAVLAAWATLESTRSLYNPLATTWKKPGATAYNYNGGNPVKNYSSFEDGVSATVSTLNQGYYTAIRTAMRSGTKTPREIVDSEGVRQALDTWGSGGNKVAAVIASGVTSPPPLYGGDAQAFGRNVTEPVIVEGDIVSADTGTVTETSDEVLGFTGQSNVKYGTIRPTAGMKVLQFSTPKAGEYTTGNALEVTVPEMTVPTSEIQIVTFSAHSLALSTLTVRGADGQNLGANLSQPPQATVADMLKGYLLRATSASPGDTLTARYEDTYSEVIDNIAKYLYDNAERPKPRAILQAATTPEGPTYYAKVVQARAFYGDLENALANQTGADNNALDFGATVLENFTGRKNAPAATAESRGTRALCGTLANGAALFYNLVLTALQQAAKQVSGTAGYGAAEMVEAYGEMYAGRNAYLQDYASTLGLTFTPPVAPTGDVKVSFLKNVKQPTYTPVFPVSDARGYEVVGSQRYGRGLTAATFKDIMLSTRQIEADTGLNLSSRALIGDISTTATTFEAIEAFYAELGKQRASADLNISAAFGNLNPEYQDALLTAAADNVDIGDGYVDFSVLNNAIVTTSNYGQRVQFTSNVPARLADIEVATTGTTPCSCKVHDAQTYLLASTGEYVSLDTEQEVTEFLLAEARLKTQTWKQARDAISGKNQ